MNETETKPKRDRSELKLLHFNSFQFCLYVSMHHNPSNNTLELDHTGSERHDRHTKEESILQPTTSIKTPREEGGRASH